jgi:hypothetical protein
LPFLSVDPVARLALNVFKEYAKKARDKLDEIASASSPRELSSNKHTLTTLKHLESYSALNINGQSGRDSVNTGATPFSL